jgi:hypothetical protein
MGKIEPYNYLSTIVVNSDIWAEPMTNNDEVITSRIDMRRETRRYFNGDINEPAQWHCYVCNCGCWLRVHSAKHWTHTNWQHKACKQCSKRINLNMGKIHLEDTKQGAIQYIHSKVAGERMRVLEAQIIEQDRVVMRISKEKGGLLAGVNQYQNDLGKAPYGCHILPQMWDAWMNELWWVNRKMWEDIHMMQNTKERDNILLFYFRWRASSNPVEYLETGRDKFFMRSMDNGEFNRQCAFVNRWFK